MKQLFLAAIAAVAFFSSCEKGDEIFDGIETPVEASVVNLSFTDHDPTTKAFFSSSAAAEVWEKQLTNVTIFAFEENGDFVLRREFDAEEIAAKRSSFALPGISAGDVCRFYVVANIDIDMGVISESALLSAIEGSAVLYNDSFTEVTKRAKRTDGFVMSGKKSITIVNGTTNITTTIKRTVAKIALQISKSDEFDELYSGDVFVNNVTISRAASQSRVIAPSTPATGAMNFSHNQTSNVSGRYFQNLFYIFENGPISDRVLLTINAIYDRDGNFATTTDQAPMTYTLSLNGSDGSGSILRNGYYRVAVSLNGVTGADATMSITVADWESPKTQDVELGK